MLTKFEDKIKKRLPSEMSFYKNKLENINDLSYLHH